MPGWTTLLLRERRITAAGLAAVTLLAWIYTLAGAGMGMSAFEMTAMTPPPGQPGMAMPVAQWTAGYAMTMLAMWWVMMIAMMLPSAAPMILLFDKIQSSGPRSGPQLMTAIFTGGYLLAWLGFSLLAVLLQWSLATADWLSPMMTAQTVPLAGGLLIAAGLYQLTPAKHACLSQCRAPTAFIAGHWRAGIDGAFRMGIEHGLFCLGCCWAIMALLFVGGVMNLYWIAGLAVLVLAEKTLPAGRLTGYVSGLALIVWGLWLLSTR